MIFAVLDPSPLTVCINCSFFTFFNYSCISLNQADQLLTYFSRGRCASLISYFLRYERISLPKCNVCQSISFHTRAT